MAAEPWSATFCSFLSSTRRRVLLRRDDNSGIQESAAILLDITDARLNAE